MKIVLDLDGVCYEWEKTARYMLRRKFAQEGRPIPAALFQESLCWDHVEDAVTKEDWKWLWSEGVTLGLFRYGHCCRGAIEGVQTLSDLGEVHIVTARPPAAVQDTKDWIAFMFDKAVISGLHFTGRDSKSVIEADVYIDDSADNIIDLRNRGKTVIAVTRLWTGPVGNLRLAASWPEIVQHVRELKEATA